MRGNMKLLMMIILASCAQTPQAIRTTTTTITRYAQPEPIAVTQSQGDYDFTDIDEEIDKENDLINAIPDSSLNIDDLDSDKFEAEVTLGETRVRR